MEKARAELAALRAGLERGSALAQAMREKNERYLASMRVTAEAPVAAQRGDGQEAALARGASDEHRMAAAARARHLRTLRKKIAEDPEAFFGQADVDRSQDLSWDEWQKICQVHVEDIDLDTVRALFDEVAQARDAAGTISHARCLQVAEEF